jgi:2-oxo-4-hydroxy-4-carboxy-5-ureidoimidazoline decarboxylase
VSGLAHLNALPADEAAAAFLRCCGAQRWADTMVAARPFPSLDELHEVATATWLALPEDDWLEAFAHHPTIGDRAALEQPAATASGWEAREQGGVAGAATTTLDRLAELNRRYRERFGYVYLVCATGKSADEMLALLEQRIDNDPAVELPIAAAEQDKITHLRLEALIDECDHDARA